MSGREFTISDLPKIGSYVTVHPKEDWGPGLVTHSRLKFIEIVWACEGGETSMSWSGKNVKTGLSFIKPSAQPHVAAGRGFKDRLRAIIKLLELGGTQEHVDECMRAVEALLDEVVELPPIPETFTVPNGGKSLAEVFGPEYAEQMAAACLRDAALVRAATSSEDKASQ